MRHIVFTKRALQWESTIIPQPGSGEALIWVEARSVRLTVRNCIRGYPGNDSTLMPWVPGNALAERVETVGEGVFTPKLANS